MKHIAIAGSAFCGSTMLALILGSLPGAQTIGDSKYLTEKWVDKDDKSLGRHSPPITATNFDQFNTCRYCKPLKQDCPYHTLEFRASLQADPRDWYGKIARRLGTECLVSSDKDLRVIRAKDPSLDHDLLVPFKSPARAWMSGSRADRQTALRYEMSKFLDEWSKRYRPLLDDYDNAGKKLFLNLQDFVAAPADGLRFICDFFGLEFSERALSYWEHEHHYIGGNFHVYYNVMKNERPVEIAPMGPLTLSGEEIDAVSAHKASREIHERLIDRYQKARSA